MKIEKINYLEIPTTNLKTCKKFFYKVFDFKFVDYGNEYSAFSNAGIEGGFFKSKKIATSNKGSVLIVFLSEDLDSLQQKITASGGKISKPVFSFPGGKRFHFKDPNGGEFAAWSKTSEK